MTKKRKQWHVQVGTTVRTFSTKRAAKAFAHMMLGDDRAVWASWSK